MDPRPNFLKLSIAASAIAAASSLPLQAAEWTIAPTVEIQTGHDSNLRLARGAKDGVLESNLKTQVVAKRRTETSDVSLTGGYTVIKYGNEGDNINDRDQQFAQGVYRKKWTRWAMGLSGGVRRDDLLRTIDGSSFDNGNELGAGAGTPLLPDETPLDDLGDDGTGNPGFDIEEQIRRTFWRAATYAQYELSERDRVRLGYGYAQRDYRAGDLTVDIRDSKRHTIDLQYARDLSERSVFLTTVSASKLETEGSALTGPNSTLDSDFYQGLVSWRARFDERTRIEIGAGVSHVEAEEANETGFLIRARGTTRFGNGKLTGELRRALVPNAFGNVAETDLFRLRYSRSLTERLNLGLETSGQFRERGADDQRSDRDHIRAGISASWVLSSSWSLTSRYDYSWIDRSGDAIANPGNTSGHRVLLGVAWSPQTIRVGQ